MFWNMQNQNNPIGSQATHVRWGTADRGQHREAVALADVPYAAHFGLMSDVAASQFRANNGLMHRNMMGL
jgi:hypothetical protein